jgi:membrane protein DedA with SNARE-associated domain
MIELPFWVYAAIGFLVWTGFWYILGFLAGMRHKEIIYVRKEKEVSQSNER